MVPIGWVRSPIREPLDDCWGNLVSTIELDASRFTPDCTLGLEQYSHAEIVFFLDQVPESKIITGSRHPRGRQDWPLTGIFAHRAKNRPNRIVISTCQLECVDGLKIRVRELDAVDGTPVLDVKPYLRGFAPRGEVREPAWSVELMSRYFRKI